MSKKTRDKTKDEKSKTFYQRCYKTHPGLKIGDHVIYGGSCSEPIVNDADVYVGLDFSMSENKYLYPWNDKEAVFFRIPDMGTPKSVVEFKKLIDWLAAQLIAGKKVHVGCMGGHGRTGLVLSALVKVMTGNEDATTYVRANYCEKAVESAEQVAFLKKHFGIKEVKPAKSYSTATFSHSTGYYGGTSTAGQDDGWWKKRDYLNPKGYDYTAANHGTNTDLSDAVVKPVPSNGSIWGRSFHRMKTFDK